MKNKIKKIQEFKQNFWKREVTFIEAAEFGSIYNFSLACFNAEGKCLFYKSGLTFRELSHLVYKVVGIKNIILEQIIIPDEAARAAYWNELEDDVC